MLKLKLLATLVGTTLGVAACPGAQAQSDTSNSQRVGNLQFGNSLDPDGWRPFEIADPRGMSWLHPGQLRTPTGALYPWPHQVAEDGEAEGEAHGKTDWSWFGLLQLGFLSTSGDAGNASFREYTDWDDGPVLGFAAISGVNRETGGFVEFRGSRLGGDDQYYRLRAGRYGASRFEFFHREATHTLGTDAYPFWDGVGGTDLVLPAGLATGDRRAAVLEAMAARPRQSLAVVREATGAGVEAAATRHWIGYANVSRERREGQRTWGGPMYLTYFFGSPGAGGTGAPGVPGTSGGQYETVRPVDFTTTDIHLGVRNKGGALGWLVDFSLNGSFFRDRKDHLSFQAPFAVAPGATSMIDGGTWALEPDNDYYNVRLEASHPLRFWRGNFSFTASWSSMRQDDPLQAPLDPRFCPDGALIGASGIACSDWNSTAALSRDSAAARIDTSLVDLRADFRPTDALRLFAHLQRHGEDNRTRYTMFNPLTGQYGYVAENGTVVLLIPEPAFSGLFEPGDPAYASVFARVASIPFSEDRTSLEVGGEHALGERDSLGLRYRVERRSPQWRERTRITEQRLSLDWDGRVWGDATLRMGYERERRTGGRYDPNPYLDAFSPSMPGYVPPPTGYTAFTVAQMSKYDIGDMDSGKLSAIVVVPVGLDATFTGNLHGQRRDYGTVVGRRSFDTLGADASWDWAPSPATSMGAYAGYESSRLAQGNVADNEALTFSSPDQGDMEFGGPFFPFANFWSAVDEERNINAGAWLRHAVSPRVRFDLGYDFTDSRGRNRYDAANLAAISVVYARILDQTAIGDRFPDNVFRRHELTANLDLALAGDLQLRLFCKYQRGRFLDWHRAGFETPADLVIGNRVFTELAPPSRWQAMVLGAFITVPL